MVIVQLFILSSLTSAENTTLLKRVMADLPGLAFSISHTTRQARTGEVDGVDYYFVDKAQFESLREDGNFLEWAKVHGNFYGTSRQAVQSQLDLGVDIVMDIDVQGAALVRQNQSLPSISIFISPPSLDELEKRLRGRATDQEENIRLRLENAAKEMAEAQKYDYLIINDNLDEAVNMLRSVILAERARGQRLPSGEAIQFVARG